MSGVYIGVDGKARKIKGGYIGVDGKARKIKKGYIGVNGVARLCWSDVDPVFANNSWEGIAVACQNGNVPDSWRVGDQKTMTIDGTDYTIDIIGKNHDDYADGSGKAPLTFQLHDCYITTTNMQLNNTNSGGWTSSKMRTSDLPSILSKMPIGVQTIVRKVKKLTSEGGLKSTIVTTEDDLFLLSEVEVFGVANNSFHGEGTQYEYYKTTANRVKTLNGTATAWWERSPNGAYSSEFCKVYSNGVLGSSNANVYDGISFAFCF